MALGGSGLEGGGGGGAIPDPLLIQSGLVSAPGLGFDGDADTGIYSPGADIFGIVAGGVEAVRYSEVSGAVIRAMQANVGLTADPGSSQGDGVITSSENIYSTVATAGDAATLPAAFGVGTKIYVQNDGAESMDVFPASGDDAGAGVDTAVAVAAGAAAWFTGIAANTTWTNRVVGGSGGVSDPLLLGNGSAAAPTYSFTSDPDTGVFRAAADALGFTAGGVEGLRIIEVGGFYQVLLPNDASGDEAATPSLGFGDGDSGFYESADDALNVSLAGVALWQWDGDQYSGRIASAPSMRNVSSSATVPNLLPHSGDADTGIGHVDFDQLSLIAGGVEGMRITEIAAAITAQVNGTLQTSNAAGPQLLDVAAGITTPTIIPDRADPDTGIGTNGSGVISIIGDGVDIAQFRDNAGASQQLMMEDGAIGAPAYAFIQDQNLGFYRSGAGVITMVDASTAIWSFQAVALAGGVATGPALRNEAVSAINPTILPNKADADSGIGQNAADQVSIIAGAVEIARAVESTFDQLIVSPGALLGSAAAPAIALGDGDTGFSEDSDDDLVVSSAGLARWHFFGNNFSGNTAGSPELVNAVGSSDTPVIIPNQSDTNTGIGWVSSDIGALVAGGINVMQWGEVGSDPLMGFFGGAAVAQPAAYTRNATIVEDRTLLASASATATNNNNVLAALIADLQSVNLLQ